MPPAVRRRAACKRDADIGFGFRKGGPHQSGSEDGAVLPDAVEVPQQKITCGIVESIKLLGAVQDDMGDWAPVVE
jgi:hypothetical protein